MNIVLINKTLTLPKREMDFLQIIYLTLITTLLQNSPECSTVDNNSSVLKIMNDVSKMWHCITEKHEDIIPNEHNVFFRLYTRKNRNHPELLILNIEKEVEALRTKMIRRRRDSFLPLNKNAIIHSRYFVPKAETKILIHGYSETLSNTKMIDIKNGYLERGEYNVILVDWGLLTNSTCYMHAAKAVSKVGVMIGRLLDQLILSGVSLTSMHIIGFSLGAHVAGFAGKNVKLGVVKRITGLDPALPMFIATDSTNRLHQSDAAYVDIIHTCAGILGIRSRIGHADFYPNGGFQQAGCYDVVCSHSRAPVYYFESVLRPSGFKALQCDSWKHFLGDECNKTSYSLMGDASDIGLSVVISS
ncbi:lipase member H-A isoform X2 [Cephus cinctus]|uniref:phospholipase A1 n=1 Tax=Cephus cinctus TaxID=211228 RepID=A0AAJ7BIL6_CEPCN|nr:lipase member H-A isoform X2 [Cephus cinctus]